MYFFLYIQFCLNRLDSMKKVFSCIQLENMWQEGHKILFLVCVF